ncbi:MAG: outer membrane beta-barrel protein, partial [Lentimicrobiaceae bacterium]|nr:outer membrane beta-barrel protein [Lentimicrobiaceae bacterium]
GLLFPLRTQAQFGGFEMGVSAGLTYNQLHTQSIRPLSKYEPELGFGVSVPMQCVVRNWFAFAWDFSCIQKNYVWHHSNFARQSTRNTYVQLPAMLRFSFGGKRFRLFVSAGGFGGYLLHRNVSGTIFNVFDMGNSHVYNEKSGFDPRRDQRFEWGLLAGGGMECRLKKQCRIFIEARYYYGTSDLQKENYMISQIPRYNDALLFQAGCLFNLSNTKNRSNAKETPADYPKDNTEVLPQSIETAEDTAKSGENTAENTNQHIDETTENETPPAPSEEVFSLDSGYYIQLFVLKNKRTAADIKEVVHALGEDAVVAVQKEESFVYLVGVFPSKKEAEDKLEYYKKYAPDAFVTKF